jgi:hypothetical protein
VTPRFHLAQVNIARLRAPLDSALLADFVAALDPINALADGSPGFVWRLQTPAGNATALRVFDDDQLIVNLSTWLSLDTLAAFVYQSAHAAVMRKRRRWFHAMPVAFIALWWVPAGHRPTVDEAEERLRHLRANGPSPFAFTFRAPFPTQGDGQPIDPVAATCPA